MFRHFSPAGGGWTGGEGGGMGEAEGKGGGEGQRLINELIR